MIKRPSLKKLQAECDRFNAAVPVGSKVLVQLDNHDEPMETTTRSAAEVLSGHSAVVWLDGVRGCYLLSRIKPVASSAEVSS
ncbi:hypothetical protein GTU79_19745 [Sodalis ligni]|uniref:hypothetical protein n=1 Tax=Sodalis ligni TaxID=2697027 RepID=UPI00193FE862|nr:hypothetical protein [Sodalis ligni]QWA09573.1 hypothetical protein GTU79_19745 [Sodalis ligni]